MELLNQSGSGIMGTIEIPNINVNLPHCSLDKLCCLPGACQLPPNNDLIFSHVALLKICFIP